MCLWESPNRQDTNWPAQLQRPARILKFRIYKLEVPFCLGSEQQRCWSDCTDSLSAWRKLGLLATQWVYSEDSSSLGAHAILLVLSQGSSNALAVCTDLWSKQNLGSTRLFTKHGLRMSQIHFALHSLGYRNVPKFLDRQVWANSADPDQTAIPSASFGCITLRKSHLVQLLGWLQQIFRCPKF